MKVEISRSIKITFSHDNGKPWCISDFSTISGKDYIPLTKKDNGFNRFVTGSNRGETGLRDYIWLDTLRKARNRAVDDWHSPVVTSGQQTLFGAAATPAKKRKKLETLAPRPGVVTLDLPAFDYENCEGEAVEVSKISMRVRADDPLKSVAIELTEDNLQYIYHAVSKGDKLDTPSTRRKNMMAPDVTQVGGMFLATRQKAGKEGTERRYFTDPDVAQRWIQYEAIPRRSSPRLSTRSSGSSGSPAAPEKEEGEENEDEEEEEDDGAAAAESENVD